MPLKFSIILLLVFVNAVYAQLPTAIEIKENKIKRIVILRNEATNPSLVEWYYDDNGYDTAKYENGKRLNYKKIDYNTKNQPIKITQYSDDGRLMDVSVYTYKPDNSFIIKNTDSQFGLVNTATYDKKKNIVKYTIPDGSEIKYVYNAKGKLVKSYSIPKNSGVKMTQTLTYNAKGKIEKSTTVGDYPGSITYQYNANGLLIKTTSVGNGESPDITDEYTYFY